MIFQTVMQTYTQEVWLTNNFASTVELTIRSSSSDRYTVTPSKLQLEPGKSAKLVRQTVNLFETENDERFCFQEVLQINFQYVDVIRLNLVFSCQTGTNKSRFIVFCIKSSMVVRAWRNKSTLLLAGRGSSQNLEIPPSQTNRLLCRQHQLISVCFS